MATAGGRDGRACYLPGIVDRIAEVPVSSASKASATALTAVLRQALVTSTFIEVQDRLTPFGKRMAIAGLTVTVIGSVLIPYANYRHTLQHDKEVEEQQR